MKPVIVDVANVEFTPETLLNLLADELTPEDTQDIILDWIACHYFLSKMGVPLDVNKPKLIERLELYFSEQLIKEQEHEQE